MTVHDPFDHRPDATIGGLLRDHLRVDDHEAFVVRMKAAARRGLRGARPASVREWDLLAGWFRPGMAAAVAILLGALLGVGRELRPGWPRGHRAAGFPAPSAGAGDRARR